MSTISGIISVELLNLIVKKTLGRVDDDVTRVVEFISQGPVGKMFFIPAMLF